MKHLFLMNPLSTVKPWKDTTYHLMLAAAERDHDVYMAAQNDLTLRHDVLFASVVAVTVFDNHDKPFETGAPSYVEVASFDCVWERTDPPFNRRYLYTTLLLDFLPEPVRVINRPSAIRDFNEKLAALKFPSFTPGTLVTADPNEIRQFIGEHGRITLKPVDGHGGKGVEFCDANSKDLTGILERVTAQGTKWTIAQQYLAAASEGDKRILLLDGEPIGAILRVHAEGKELNNLDAGGTANPTELTERDHDISAAVGPVLQQAGIVFAGIDIIGGLLIEVNVTSPTGLQEASKFSGKALNHRIIESLEG
ncbi:MAG: glutathione synthetase [marine bacterium B5-7]|nr:MAG: glutathione synthetase [marine bacterium B5-7]